MNYLIQEIETMRKRIRGHERVAASMAKDNDELRRQVNNLTEDFDDARLTVSQIAGERDTALSLLAGRREAA